MVEMGTLVVRAGYLQNSINMFEHAYQQSVTKVADRIYKLKNKW